MYLIPSSIEDTRSLPLAREEQNLDDAWAVVCMSFRSAESGRSSTLQLPYTNWPADGSVLNGKFHTFCRATWRFLLPRYAPLSHPYLSRDAEPVLNHHRVWQPLNTADWPVTSRLV